MNTERVIIVGSGPAAAGAALALTAAGYRDIRVLDLGGMLEPETREVVESMASRPAKAWSADEVRIVSQQPVATTKGALPQKRIYGSDFPFRDMSQLDGMGYRAGANQSPVSSAYGGFSNVWGAQLMPFSRSTFETWPVSWEQMRAHYSAVLDEVPLAGEADDLLNAFPLLTDRARPLPPLAARSQRILDRYAKHHSRILGAGVRLGRARLAMDATECVRCGLCMTGCPYGLIYSASQTFNRLRKDGLVTYLPGVLATGVGEDAGGCFVRVRELQTGRHETMRADRLFLACGGIGSTRLVFGSRRDRPDHLTMSESMQFAVPFVSTRAVGDPRTENAFTLNQFNILVGFDDVDYHTSQIHCYPYNPTVLDALPAPLRSPALTAMTGRVLDRLTIGLGYLPSWASPPVRLQVGGIREDGLPDLTIGSEVSDSRPLMLSQVMRRLRKLAPLLDLYPIEPAMRMSAAAKSYHFGGTLPHQRHPVKGQLGTDVLGRPTGWERIHVVDGSVLPSVPSTTFTFTVMANAHRIASEVAAAG
jgi:choline dehydrogenase-like flavoprotein